MKHAIFAIAVLYLVMQVAAVADQPLAERRNSLHERWRSLLSLHSPTNAIVGRIGEETRLCVQGTELDEARKHAAIETLGRDGRSLWRSRRESDSLPGAYLQWIPGQGKAGPGVLYSYVPETDDEPGGARLVDATDGRVRGEIANTTRFGNNNSLVADVDEDGTSELLYADQKTLTCYDLPGLTRRWRFSEGVVFCWSLPALFDLDADGRREIVFGSEYNNERGDSSMIAIDAKGRRLWRSDGHAEDLGSTPAFPLDIDGDGRVEIVKVGLDLEHRQQQEWNHVHVFDAKGKLLRRIEFGCTGIALADFDGDGHVEGVGLSNTRDGGHNGRKEIRCVDLVTGERRWATPIPRAYLDTNSPLVADVDGDGRLEAIVGAGNPSGYARLPNSEPWGDLYVVRHDGVILERKELPGWPVNLAMCDLEDDKKAELVVVIDGQPGWLGVYDTAVVATRRDWPTPLGDSARSGGR